MTIPDRAAPGWNVMPEVVYHADPCESPSLSSSLVSTIIDKTLADAKYQHPRLNPDHEAEDSTKFDLGSTAHRLMLGAGADLQVIFADDWRTKDAKQQREDAIAQGKQPVLAKVYDNAVAMVEAARDQLADDHENADAFTTGHGEQVGIASINTASGPVLCRAMMDWRMADAPRIYDYKTFAPGADPDNFVRYLFREARDVQDPFYSAVYAEIEGIDWREVEFRYVVQSPYAPYVLSVVQLDEQARAFARERMDWAMSSWADALRTGKFGGYLPRTHYAAAPPFAFTSWQERMLAEQHAAALDARAGDQ